MPPPSEGLRKAASRYLMRDSDPERVMMALSIRWICIAFGTPAFIAMYLVLGSPRTLFVWMGFLMLPYLLVNAWASLAARQRFPRLLGWFLMVVDLVGLSVPIVLFDQLRVPLFALGAVMILGGATMWSSRPAAIATAIGFGWCALALVFGAGGASLGGADLGLFPEPKHAHDIAALTATLLIVLLAGAMALHSLGLMRRRAKAAEARYRAVFESVNSPIFVIDRETGKYLDANEAALESVRMTRDQVLGSQLGDLMMPESKARLREWLLENPNSLGHPVVHRLVRQGGREFFMEMSVGMAEFQGREVTVAAVRDRTPEMQLQKAEREYAERLSLTPSITP
jgi:PAS domain S-box-containing protein